ncbi:MAG: helix-hairpin-helix domain-containing protein [Methanobacterium sp.]
MHENYTSPKDDHADLHYNLREKKCKILDEMWNLTINYLDSSFKDCMECAEELKVIEKIENTEEFKSFLEELESIKKELNALYIDYLEQECESNLKKEKIIALKEKFQDDIRTSEIVEAVNCSRSYARQFYIIDGKVEQKDKRTRIGKKDKDTILRRDNYSCVACGCSDSLEVHHIIPLRGSSIKELDDECNLVSLCKNCHYLAHSGNYYKGLAYKDVEDFWEWTKNTERTLIWLILKDIDGIGVKISENIYSKFKSVEELKKADLRSLKRVPLVNKQLALRIKLKLDHAN